MACGRSGGAIKRRFVRLLFPEIRDWSGEVRVTGPVGGARGPIVVSIRSDADWKGELLPCVVEGSEDGLLWAPTDAVLVREPI